MPPHKRKGKPNRKNCQFHRRPKGCSKGASCGYYHDPNYNALRVPQPPPTPTSMSSDLPPSTYDFSKVDPDFVDCVLKKYGRNSDDPGYFQEMLEELGHMEWFKKLEDDLLWDGNHEVKIPVEMSAKKENFEVKNMEKEKKQEKVGEEMGFREVQTENGKEQLEEQGKDMMDLNYVKPRIWAFSSVEDVLLGY